MDSFFRGLFYGGLVLVMAVGCAFLLGLISRLVGWILGRLTGRRWERQSLEPMLPVLRQSLKGYRTREYVGDRVAYWDCLARQFSIRVGLQATENGLVRATVTLGLDSPFAFEIRMNPGAGWATRLSGGHVLNGVEFRGLDQQIEWKLLRAPELKPLVARLKLFDSVQVTEGNVTAEKLFRGPFLFEDWSKAFGGLITFVRLLMRFQKASAMEAPGGQLIICPYCRGEVGEEDSGVHCEKCRTLHHRECWDQTGRCSVFGCRDRRVAVVREV